MGDQTTAKLIEIGIISYKEQETLLEILRRCAKTTGLPLAGFAAVATVKSGVIAVPGVGTVAAPLVAAAAGLIVGTTACTALNLTMREELRKLSRIPLN